MFSKFHGGALRRGLPERGAAGPCDEVGADRRHSDWQHPVARREVLLRNAQRLNELEAQLVWVVGQRDVLQERLGEVRRELKVAGLGCLKGAWSG